MSIRARIFGLLVCLFSFPGVGRAQCTSPVGPGQQTSKAKKQARLANRFDAAQVEIRNQDGIVNVLIEGQLFTSMDSKRYRTPIFYPAIAPSSLIKLGTPTE